MSDEPHAENKNVAKIKTAFNMLCDEHQPQIFLAVTVDKDMMVSYASYGVENQDAIELLKHMIEYFKEGDATDEQEDRTIH